MDLTSALRDAERRLQANGLALSLPTPLLPAKRPVGQPADRPNARPLGYRRRSSPATLTYSMACLTTALSTPVAPMAPATASRTISRFSGQAYRGFRRLKKRS
jgi:hypothetical protein